jgi:hypothetical protein
MVVVFKYLLVFILGGTVLTQVVLPPFIGKKFFWLLRSKPKKVEPKKSVTVGDLEKVISDAKQQLLKLDGDFKKDLDESKKEEVRLQKLIDVTKEQIGKIS